MKKPSFSHLFRQRSSLVKFFRTSPSIGHKDSQNLFLAWFRCPNDQLQFVAMPLSFMQTQFAEHRGGIVEYARSVDSFVSREQHSDAGEYYDA